MAYTSALFITCFLPLLWLTWLLVPKKNGNTVLLAGSMVFYAWAEPTFIFIILLTTLADFFLVQKIHLASTASKKKLYAGLCIGINLLVLFSFKYVTLFLQTLLFFMPNSLRLPETYTWLLPAGISFYTFETITYVIDVYRGLHAPQRRFGDYLLYILLFPKLISGPIVRYYHMATQLDTLRHTNQKQWVSGFFRFALGIFKKVWLADKLGFFFVDYALSLPADNLSFGAAWLAMIGAALQLYLDFSAYSDIAIGLLLIFGIHIPENFEYPLSARGVTQFWQRWHISLGSWFKEYLYIPLGGNRQGSGRTYLNLLLVFAACGLWHGAGYHFLLFGLWFGVFMLIERRLEHKAIFQKKSILLVPYQWLVLVGAMVWFSQPNLQNAIQWFQVMGNPGKSQGLFPHINYLQFLLLSILLIALSETHKVKQFFGSIFHLQYANKLTPWLIITAFILLILSLSSVTSQGFKPFIYFRF